MSLKHHNARRDAIAPGSIPGTAPGSVPAMTPAQLAHELNNLLDGSLRSLSAVMRRLNTLGVDAQTTDPLAERLRAADRSMHHMADVIERYANAAPGISHADAGGFPGGALWDEENLNHPSAHGSGQAAEVFRGRGTMLDALTHAVNVYGPAIEQQGSELVTRLDPGVGDLPAGPIYTVLANAINNAMQAIGRCDPAPDHPRITIRITCGNDVVVEVLDTGSGLDPVLFDPRGGFRFGVTTRANGHGIGLGVCRQIAEDLGGSLELAPNPEAERGTRLTLRYPRPDIEKYQAGARLAG